VHVIPNVSVVKATTIADGNEKKRVVALLKVTNPTLGSIRLRLAPSSYRGEPYWDDGGDAVDSNATTEDADAPAPRNPILTDLLVDTWTQTRVDAKLVERKVSNAEDVKPTDTVELLSAEDSIIEMGSSSRARQVPDEVSNWAPATSATSASTMSLKAVAHSASTAWFEMSIPGSSLENEEGNEGEKGSGTGQRKTKAPAVPFALQIEIGNGSWESSLIQPLQGVVAAQKGEEAASAAAAIDRVTFDLVLIVGATRTPN